MNTTAATTAPAELAILFAAYGHLSEVVALLDGRGLDVEEAYAGAILTAIARGEYAGATRRMNDMTDDLDEAVADGEFFRAADRERAEHLVREARGLI